MDQAKETQDLYADSKKPNEVGLRRQSATSDLNKIYETIGQPEPAGILELGPGMGAVTEALRQRFPASRIVAIDRDPDEGIKKAALGNNAKLIVQDIATLNAEGLKMIIKEEDIDQIIALRTSPQVAAHILSLLQQEEIPVPFVFSLIDNSFNPNALDDQIIRHKIYPKVTTGELKKIPLVESRAFNEIAYVFGA